MEKPKTNPTTTLPGRKRASKAKKTTSEDLGVYINLLTDFGFKRIFGIKELMLHFLNTVLAQDLKNEIVDLHYENPERLGLTKYDRKAVYDLFCITGNGERIIVEIQAVPQLYFKDRTLVYVSRLIQEQSKKGKEWDFMLHKIYSINILGFPLDYEVPALGEKVQKVEKEVDNKTEKFASYVQLIDRDTKQLFYDKLTFVYIELKRFTKELQDLKTFFEQWIFIIKHLHELDNLPEKLHNEVFEKLFETAKIARMTKTEVNNYLKDLSDMNIVKNEIKARDRMIAERDNVIAVHVNALAQKDNVLAQKDNALAEQANIIAEYQRRYGKLNYQ